MIISSISFLYLSVKTIWIKLVKHVWLKEASNRDNETLSTLLILIDLVFFIIVSLKYLDEAPANGVDHGNSSDQIAPSSSRLKPEQSERSPGKKGVTKEVMFDIGDSRRSSNSYVPSESDLEDDEESSQQEMDLLDDTSRIPRYL